MFKKIILSTTTLAVAAIACKGKQQQASQKTIDNALSSKGLFLNDCSGSGNSISEQVVKERVEPILKDIIFGKDNTKLAFSKDDKERELYTQASQLILKLMKKLPQEHSYLLALEPRFRIYVFSDWPHNNSCDTYFGKEPGVEKSFACWNIGDSNPGLLFGPGSYTTKNGEVAEVKTIDAIKHGFIRGLISYQNASVFNKKISDDNAEELTRITAIRNELKGKIEKVMTEFKKDLAKAGNEDKIKQAEEFINDNGPGAVYSELEDSRYCSARSKQYLEDHFKGTLAVLEGRPAK